LTVRIKDEDGHVWQELSATGTPGLNVVAYDLSADPKKADAAEAAARAKAAAKAKEAEKAEKSKAAKASGKKPATPQGAADKPEAKPPDEEPATDEEDEAATSSSSGKADVDAELERILADPLRSTRARYLKPGKYTVELRAGAATSSTTLTLKAAKESDEEDEPAER
jgi:hypothetical protein